MFAGNSSPSLPAPAPAETEAPTSTPTPPTPGQLTATALDGLWTRGATPDRKAHLPFIASNFARWRTALRGYVTAVRPGNQKPLDAVRVPFATYLNGMHSRIHPIFAESILESLDALPANHPLNDQNLAVVLEIVLAADGSVKQLGVVRTSGLTAFDIAALDSIDRAQPFGPVPSAIQSADGNVYVQWKLQRNEVYACSTMEARPFLLTGTP